MKVPYVGFSNESLRLMPEVKPGDLIDCPWCKGKHPLNACDDGRTILMFYRCGDMIYLGAVAGHCVIGYKSDVSGSVPTPEPEPPIDPG